MRRRVEDDLQRDQARRRARGRQEGEAGGGGPAWRRVRSSRPGPTKPRVWDFDDANIFAQIDAFVRCRDLLEACEGQLSSPRGALAAAEFDLEAYPVFGGLRGLDVTAALSDIEAHFSVHLGRLKSVSYWILDVRATAWHDDYSAFKTAVKEFLEVMMQNCNTAFETVGPLVELGAHLEAFGPRAAPAIRRCVQKKTGQIFRLFRAEFERPGPRRRSGTTSRGSRAPPCGPRPSSRARWTRAG